MGAAARYLERDNPDCSIEWEWWIECAGRLAAVLVDVVGSGYASGDDLRDKIATLEALAYSAATLHDWFAKLKTTLEQGVDEEFVIDREADRIARFLFVAVKELKSRFGI